MHTSVKTPLGTLLTNFTAEWKVLPKQSEYIKNEKYSCKKNVSHEIFKIINKKIFIKKYYL